MATSTHDVRMELAIVDLHKQAKPNFMATSKKHGLARTTLRERFYGQTLSKQAAASEYRQRCCRNNPLLIVPSEYCFSRCGRTTETIL